MNNGAGNAAFFIIMEPFVLPLFFGGKFLRIMYASFFSLGIPSRIAWGSKRSTYYKTDFVDKDHGKFIGSDAEEAEEEEREARELQAKFAADLADEDFGIPAEQVWWEALFSNAMW